MCLSKACVFQVLKYYKTFFSKNMPLYTLYSRIMFLLKEGTWSYLKCFKTCIHMIHSQLPFIPDDPLQKFGISFPSLTLFMTKTLSIHYLAPKTNDGMIGPSIFKKILSLGDCHPNNTSSPQTSNWHFKGSLGKVVLVFSIEPNCNVNVINICKQNRKAKTGCINICK